MDLDIFIADIKRKSQYGNVAVINDKMTGDILTATVESLDLIAKHWPWDWLNEPLTITLLSGVTDYTLPATVSGLVDLVYSDDRPVSYKRIGRDPATGARKIRITSPEALGPVLGFGKKKIVPFVAADLGTAKSFLPFPEDCIYVLKAFVMAEVCGYQAKPAERMAGRAEAMRLLKAMAGGETTEPAKQPTSPVPSYYAAKKRARRGGRVS